MFPHSPFIIKKEGKNCLFSKYAKEHFVQEESRESLLRKHYQEIYCGNLIIDKINVSSVFSCGTVFILK